MRSSVCIPVSLGRLLQKVGRTPLEAVQHFHVSIQCVGTCWSNFVGMRRTVRKFFHACATIALASL